MGEALRVSWIAALAAAFAEFFQDLVMGDGFANNVLFKLRGRGFWGSGSGNRNTQDHGYVFFFSRVSSLGLSEGVAENGEGCVPAAVRKDGIGGRAADSAPVLRSSTPLEARGTLPPPKKVGEFNEFTEL